MPAVELDVELRKPLFAQPVDRENCRTLCQAVAVSYSSAVEKRRRDAA